MDAGILTQTDPMPLAQLVTEDHPLEVEETEHGDSALGRIEITARKDGSFAAVAHPCTDLVSFAPQELSDDEAELWAGEYVDVFDDFMRKTYGLAVPEENQDIYPSGLEHIATVILQTSTGTDEVITALHAAHPGLRNFDHELADGTTEHKWVEYLQQAVKAS